jgi:glycosyltransferase involved in cell wall biosynthesis
MKILYLYTEIMGYSIATIKELIKSGAEVHVVHWDKKKISKYQVTKKFGVHFYSRSKYTVKDLLVLINQINPDITVMSGWMDKGYLVGAMKLRFKKKIVVVCFDDIWFNSIKQNFASFLGYIGIFSIFFSHAWVTGFLQFEYARRLGFKKKNIIYDLYSADTELFSKYFIKIKNLKRKEYLHRFIFIGRFETIKGVEILLKAWESLGIDKKDWELCFIGDGKLKPMLNNIKNITVKNFMQPYDLAQELTKGGCMILPSLKEPWGVVVHECAASGLPIIVSDAVGSANYFVINGYNGFSFNTGDVNSLKEKMLKFIKMRDKEIFLMSNNSFLLSKKISPETSAKNLFSLITKDILL